MISFRHFEDKTVRWLAQGYRRHIMRRAVSRAYRIYARQHSQGVAAPFDEYFVLTQVLPLLQRALTTGEKVTPVQLAELWARQISLLPTSRQQQIAATLPAATYFLSIVADTFAQSYAGQNSPLFTESAVH